MFDIAIAVARARFWYHANMTSVVNAANQLGILKDDTADCMNKNHFFKCMDALEHMGYDVKGYFEKNARKND